MKVYNHLEELKAKDFKKTKFICIDGTLKVVKDGKIEDFKVKIK